MADTPLKFKRGQELNVGNLPLEDGSVIFSTRDTTSPTTVRVDVQVNDTLQRLGLGVSSASSANTASTATRLRTARKINDGSFDGTADISVTELRPIVITDQTLDLNTLQLNDNIVGKKLYLCGTDGGSANITNRPTTDNQGFSLLVEQLRWDNGVTDYVTKQTLEYRDSHQVWVRYSNGSTWGSWTLQSTGGIASTASYAQNSEALGGSSLSQILSQSGSGNAFAGLSGSGSSTLHFTRANGGTVNFIVNNVALATLSSTANYARNAAALSGSSLSQILNAAGSGNAFVGLDTTINNVVLLTRANGSTVSKTINNVSNASSATIATSATIASTARYAQNSAALGGSSLSQILAQASREDAFVGLDTTTSNVVRLTRANGSTVQKTVNNVANATSASIATSATIATRLGRSTIGSTSRPVYLREGTPIALTSIPSSFAAVPILLLSTNLDTLRTPGDYYAGSGNTCANKPTDVNAFALEVKQAASSRYVQIMYASDNQEKTYIRYYDGFSWTAWKEGSGNTGDINAYNSVTVSNATLRFGRFNGTTGTTVTINNVANATSATVATTSNYAKNSSALGGSTLSQIVNMAGGGSAYTGVDTAINSTIRLYRANGSTSTKIINNVAHASSASIATSASISTSATRLNNFKNLLSTSTDNPSNWESYGNSVVLYNTTRLTDQPQGWGLVASFTGDNEVHQIFMDQPSGSLYHRSGNSSGWWKTWTELLDTSNFATYTTKFVTKDELGSGSGSSTGTINVDAARRIVNSDVNTRNAQSFRVGTPGSGSWTGFPSSYLYSSSSTATLKTNAYYRKQVGVLHVAAGTAYHDLVFADAGTDNGIVRVSSKGDTGLILDTTNYATYSTRYNALSSSTLTVTTAGGVNIDGGSY